jgi:hypothetical protein
MEIDVVVIVIGIAVAVCTSSFFSSHDSPSGMMTGMWS